MAINSFSGPSVFFIRDEINLNLYRCYNKNIKKRISFLIKYLLDMPFFAYYCLENRKAIHNAKLLVANSEFIAYRIQQKFKRKAVVVYPMIDIQSFLHVELPKKELRPNIMMVGDVEVKGVSIFKRIAAAMPDYRFLMVGKSYANTIVGNITYHEFVKDPITLYKTAKILLVPSVWEEAFGRVSVEAQALGIPVLVSNRGGLPETVSSSEYVINDYYDITSWTEKILWILNNYESHSQKARVYVQKFDMREQIKNLLNEIYKATGVRIESKIYKNTSLC